MDALGQLALLQARQSDDANQRQAAFGRAADALGAAWDASPYQTEYGRRLALVYEEWAEAMPDEAGRRAHLEEARLALERARRLAPADVRPRDDLTHITTLLTESR